MTMSLVEWCKAQDWWKHVHPLVQGGLYVSLHVQEEWPGNGNKLMHRPTGGVLELVRCDSPGWHVVLVAGPEDLRDRVAQVQDENLLFQPRDRRHGWGPPVAGEA